MLIKFILRAELNRFMFTLLMNLKSFLPIKPQSTKLTNKISCLNLLRDNFNINFMNSFHVCSEIVILN